MHSNIIVSVLMKSEIYIFVLQRKLKFIQYIFPGQVFWILASLFRFNFIALTIYIPLTVIFQALIIWITLWMYHIKAQSLSQILPLSNSNNNAPNGSQVISHQDNANSSAALSSVALKRLATQNDSEFKS
mmetsp:Transcript_9268/g.12748  ORF Transcript_9268/g.12748 Transcript_9268/m.12748 type:complete len:130 (-) Transcript_9268:289-678(-)